MRGGGRGGIGIASGRGGELKGGGGLQRGGRK